MSFGDLLFPLFDAVKETESTNMSQRNYSKYLESAKCVGFCGRFRVKYVTCWWNNVLRSSLSVIDGPGKWTTSVIYSHPCMPSSPCSAFWSNCYEKNNIRKVTFLILSNILRILEFYHCMYQTTTIKRKLHQT